MNTQSHAILTFYLVRRFLGNRLKRMKHLNTVIFTGAIFPDIPIFILFLWFTLIKPTPQHKIWRELYFHPEWQVAFNISHSFPLWVTAGSVFLFLRMPRGAIFSLAAFLAAAEDFFVHYDDAHAHFFPFSDYRFRSPISYWDPAHYGNIASVLEVALVAAASVWAFRRLETRWGKTILVLAAFSLLFSHGMWRFIFTAF